ncbi:hypothetical protein CEUSTIGMA_g13143.t1 [Chlamydomonas eustigma]|uniref:Uncharacterized protein n=1 Tax=Chlamydomonas eustigma TaxID=1157962 RepID=A0A250XRP2_9CHLO|nr:hypothetical protein CEUSTIGMA_g13143.t1 [Chlamydomonas eustigma]|eukprot:GAX85728.1 hypothetical protein CEUSTIGMA_g13143.t1 [Chlamydomonas eustigma]
MTSYNDRKSALILLGKEFMLVNYNNVTQPKGLREICQALDRRQLHIIGERAEGLDLRDARKFNVTREFWEELFLSSDEELCIGQRDLQLPRTTMVEDATRTLTGVRALPRTTMVEDLTVLKDATRTLTGVRAPVRDLAFRMCLEYGRREGKNAACRMMRNQAFNVWIHEHYAHPRDVHEMLHEYLKAQYEWDKLKVGDTNRAMEVLMELTKYVDNFKQSVIEICALNDHDFAS